MAFCAENDSPDSGAGTAAEPGLPMERNNRRAQQDAGACLLRTAWRDSGEARRIRRRSEERLEAIDLLFRQLLAGERGDADAAGVGGVEAFDERAGLRRNFRAWLTAFEELIEAHVPFAATTPASSSRNSKASLSGQADSAPS